MTARYTGRALAAELRATGVRVLESYERTAATDAGCNLPGGVSVQIAYGRLHLNQWVEDDQASWPLGDFATVAELVAAVRRTRTG